MPSKLPIIKANTTQKNIDKMKVIAENNKRSLAKELELIVENHIKEYEAKHGEIIIKEKEENKRKISPLNPFGAGLAVGDALGEIVVDKIKQKRD